MFKLIVLAALVAVCSAGIPHYKVGYGFVAAGYGPHGGHGSVAKVNAHQTGLDYGFSVHENSPHGHRYHVQSAVAPTGYGYGHVGGYGHGGFGHGGFGGYGHGGFY
ncbi:shematrin-like protein 1 [Folsomia candida]|uniref:Uncharacterized protein n=1 Tax=Folsomia candida TaxID=158441 RepID=A0A226E041_FOLCA|nr:shematrin-like protein 1 [Folsomia candida]OXA50337.1 hypothetical protein Fcan01_14981 [Folsomia candida]